MTLLFLSLTLLSFSAFAGEGLCLDQEQVIFTCDTAKSSKILSVCASKSLDEKDSYVQYRFGKPGNIELKFPTGKKGSFSQFRYAHYFRYQVDRSELSFTIKSYQYSVFHDYVGDTGEPVITQGVTVSKIGDPETEMEILCLKPAINRLHTLAELVPCDKESGLAGCD